MAMTVIIINLNYKVYGSSLKRKLIKAEDTTTRVIYVITTHVHVHILNVIQR